MNTKELKSAIRKVDRVKVWSSTLKIYVYVNKSKLLESLDKQVSKDRFWHNYHFSEKIDEDCQYSCLLIN